MSRPHRRSRSLRTTPAATSPEAPAEPPVEAARNGDTGEHANGSSADDAPAADTAVADLPADTPTASPPVESTSTTASSNGAPPPGTAKPAGSRRVYGPPPRRRTAGANRALNSTRRTSLTLLFAPVFLVFVLIELGREISYRLRKRAAEDQPEYVIFRRPAAMPKAHADRSVGDVVSHLQNIPHRPLPLPTHLAFYREYGAEGLGVLFSSEPALATLPHFYPGVFKPRLFEGHGGIQLAGMQAMHKSEGPALILCHGLLTSKNFDYIRLLARRAYSEWGFHVVTIDLRSWGQSAWTSDAPSSGGFMEGKDVVEIARELGNDPRVTSVGAMGFSLGGSTVLNAARHSSEDPERPITGGVLSVSAPTHIGEVVDYISVRPHWRHPFFALWVVYKAALRAGVRRLGLDPSLNNWKSLLREHAIPYYKISEEEFTTRASARNFVADIKTPTLALHAADDFVVTVDHAFALADAATDNDNVHVWVVDSGNHCAFTAVDEKWFYSVTRRWFEYWADEPERH